MLLTFDFMKFFNVDFYFIICFVLAGTGFDITLDTMQEYQEWKDRNESHLSLNAYMDYF